MEELEELEEIVERDVREETEETEEFKASLVDSLDSSAVVDCTKESTIGTGSKLLITRGAWIERVYEGYIGE